MEEDKGERKRVVEKKKKKVKKEEEEVKGRVRYVFMQENLQNENYNRIMTQ